MFQSPATRKKHVPNHRFSHEDHGIFLYFFPAKTNHLIQSTWPRISSPLWMECRSKFLPLGKAPGVAANVWSPCPRTAESPGERRSSLALLNSSEGFRLVIHTRWCSQDSVQLVNRILPFHYGFYLIRFVQDCAPQVMSVGLYINHKP